MGKCGEEGRNILIDFNRVQHASMIKYAFMTAACLPDSMTMVEEIENSINNRNLHARIGEMLATNGRFYVRVPTSFGPSSPEGATEHSTRCIASSAMFLGPADAVPDLVILSGKDFTRFECTFSSLVLSVLFLHSF
jgi:hypothetical protein